MGEHRPTLPHFLEVLRDNPTSKKHQLITPNTQGLPGAPTPGGHHIEAVLTRSRSLLGPLQPHGLPHGSLLSPPGPRWDAWQCPPGGQPVQAHSPREGHHVIDWPGPKGKELGSSKAGPTAEKPQEVRGPGTRDGCSHMGPVLREAARCPGASTCVMYLFHFPGHPFSHLKMNLSWTVAGSCLRLGE